jgi:hypothetical protein
VERGKIRGDVGTCVTPESRQFATRCHHGIFEVHDDLAALLQRCGCPTPCNPTHYKRPAIAIIRVTSRVENYHFTEESREYDLFLDQTGLTCRF